MRCRSNGDITQRVRTTHLEPTFFCTAPTDANHRLRTDSYDDGCSTPRVLCEGVEHATHNLFLTFSEHCHQSPRSSLPSAPLVAKL
jgi:hypothetical protein